MFGKNAFAMITLGLAVATGGGQAWAGATNAWEVRIVGSYFHGSTTGARFSADDTQLIQCTVNANGSTNEWVLCVARDASGTYASCWSEQPGHREVVKSMRDFAALVAIANEDGTCKSLQVYKSSMDLPGVCFDR